MCASFAYAAGYSYTCSNTSLSSIAVNDPNGADASTVSDYITKCTNAGGTVSGASAQQLNGVTGSPSAGSTASTGPCTSCNLGYTPLEPIPGVTSGVNLIDPHNLPAIINSIFTILITVGALLAVLFLTIGGVQYMLSESAGGKNEGIRRATAAMWGILLIAGIWLILHTINPNLLSFNLNPCPNGGSGCTINSNITNSTTSAQPVTTGTIDLTGDTATKDAIRSSAGIGTFSLWDGTYVTYSPVIKTVRK
jgi:hypothetical protein